MNNDLNILDSFNSNSDRFPTTNTITSQNSIHDEGIQYNESQITQQNAINSANPQTHVQLSDARTVDSSSGSYTQHNTLSLSNLVFF